MIDYETLKIVWWVLIGVLLIGFAVLGGMDLAVGFLLPILGRKDVERRLMLNSIGPTWEGNQVWFITAGGAIFAAWPIAYATSFSGMYLALLLVLLAMILRPPGFDYRSKIEDIRWRTSWDVCLFISGFVPCLLFGVAFGNLFLGLGFSFDDTMRLIFTGSFFDLLHPFALIAGVVSLSMLSMQAAVFIQLKTETPIYERAQAAIRVSALLFAASFAFAGYWLMNGLPGYEIISIPDVNGVVTPLMKTVQVSPGSWLKNYFNHPVLWFIPALTFASIAMTIVFSILEWAIAIIFSSLALIGAISTAGIALFPFILPSHTNPNQSLTIWDATSSQSTLLYMLVAAVIFVPIVLTYTTWVFKVINGKVTSADLSKPESY